MLIFDLLNPDYEKLQVLTRGKQKWRFLGLNDAFRLAENTRFHLESSFESATFAYHETVMRHALRLCWLEYKSFN
jgi:hypothetical protein